MLVIFECFIKINFGFFLIYIAPSANKKHSIIVINYSFNLELLLKIITIIIIVAVILPIISWCDFINVKIRHWKFQKTKFIVFSPDN